ncbi:sodium/hydrogen exchanger 8-like [Watersipora subatra]|uniref:sodium/hydrogen exchanger 8-like n=1 Tax=Watersipora subatra TaxID=2589382 RepID=UPI00355C47D5
MKSTMRWIFFVVIILCIFGLESKKQKHVTETTSTTVASTSSPNATTEAINSTAAEPHTTVELLLTSQSAAQEEKHSSFTIFFILLVLSFCILTTHLLIVTKFHYLPESVAIVIVGGIIGGILKILSTYGLVDLHNEEAFPPTIFFLVMLPPIIFESGYNLHKGNFFANFGTILLFAILGTVLSACVIGSGIYLLGVADVAYRLTLLESFAFGSLISAVDPVATLAIFQALDVDAILYMLVFGESVLNDAVSIVLTSTIIAMGKPEFGDVSGARAFGYGLGKFCVMFFASSAIGIASAVVSACAFKFVDLRKTPSLEIALMLIFSYLPYGLAEGLGLSGIMAVLFAGIVMSHYTHRNLSPITQITVQQTFRTVAFMAETCVFAYLGMSIFSMGHHIEVAFVLWAIVLCLVGRALNIYPLAFVANKFRSHKITPKQQFIMWFSGLRGAIAFALSLHLDIGKDKRQVLVTSTLIIVLFTLLFLGGGTMPLMTILNKKKKKSRKRIELNLSKTKEMGDTVETTSEHTEAEEVRTVSKPHISRFMSLDHKYFIPWLTRPMTVQEVREGQKQMATLTDKWYKEVSQRSTTESSSEDDLFASTERHPLVDTESL